MQLVVAMLAFGSVIAVAFDNARVASRAGSLAVPVPLMRSIASTFSV